MVAGFDPFNDRAARTIRNALSHRLQASLARGKPFCSGAADLMQRYPQRPYVDYIRDRVQRYRAATREALSRGVSPVTQAAVLCYHQLYFEAHEVLEPLWQSASGRARQGLQGLILAAGVHVHLEAGHDEAALRLARKAIFCLRQSGDTIGDPPHFNLETLVARLERLIAAADHRR
jgi:hypothetical protein